MPASMAGVTRRPTLAENLRHFAITSELGGAAIVVGRRGWICQLLQETFELWQKKKSFGLGANQATR